MDEKVTLWMKQSKLWKIKIPAMKINKNNETDVFAAILNHNYY